MYKFEQQVQIGQISILLTLRLEVSIASDLMKIEVNRTKRFKGARTIWRRLMFA